jgi:hypothetical protein
MRINNKIRRFLVLAVLILSIPALSHAASFSLASQNCLHLGWGKATYQNYKNPFLKNLFSNYNVILLQEVMSKGLPPDYVTPGSHYFLSTALKGSGSYKEAYVFIIDKNITAANNDDYGYTGAGFARPPSGVLLQTGSNWTWVVNYHAVFGKRKSIRQAEVGRMGTVYGFYQGMVINSNTYNRVIIGGDWNLPAGDAAFNNLKTAAGGTNSRVLPNSKTSLKRNGGLSQAYDHFVWNSNIITVSSVQVIDPGISKSNFRKKVSDHLGISCVVDY